MAKHSSTDTAKLSLVGNNQQATMSASDKEPIQSEAVLSQLPVVLQTTLELEQLLTLFQNELHKILAYDSFHYLHHDVSCVINSANRSRHSCHYRLEMNGVWLGELTLTRGKKFSESDVLLVEDSLCKLMYPLRNCLLYRQAQRAALQDKLTGLSNRTAFDNSLNREIDLAQRQHTPLSLVILDIDHFKVVNDTYGHTAGDMALQSLADAMMATLRRSDIAFRYGGEEFTLLLSNTDQSAAITVAERVRQTVMDMTCQSEQRQFSFTTSLGVATLERGEGISSFFDRADKALYQAKHSGRNKTVAA